MTAEVHVKFSSIFGNFPNPRDALPWLPAQPYQFFFLVCRDAVAVNRPHLHHRERCRVGGVVSYSTLCVDDQRLLHGSGLRSTVQKWHLAANDEGNIDFLQLTAVRESVLSTSACRGELQLHARVKATPCQLRTMSLAPRPTTQLGWMSTSTPHR